MPRNTSAVAFCLLVLSAVTFGQTNSGSETRPFKQTGPGPGKTADLPAGTDLFVLTMGAWDMQPADSSETTTLVTIDSGTYLRATTSGFGAELIGHIHLPAGALIDHFEVDACDEEPLNDLSNPQFLQCSDSSAGPGPCSTIDEVIAPTGTPGCYFARGTLNLNYTVQDNANNDYLVDVILPPSTLVGLRGIKIYYGLQVSQAPPVPTFNDVPVSDPAFQFIEALASSGITAGCGGGNYCPDASLTRRQMAVFLAKALGLRWPG